MTANGFKWGSGAGDSTSEASRRGSVALSGRHDSVADIAGRRNSALLMEAASLLEADERGRDYSGTSFTSQIFLAAPTTTQETNLANSRRNAMRDPVAVVQREDNRSSWQQFADGVLGNTSGSALYTGLNPAPLVSNWKSTDDAIKKEFVSTPSVASTSHGATAAHVASPLRTPLATSVATAASTTAERPKRTRKRKASPSITPQRNSDSLSGGSLRRDSETIVQIPLAAVRKAAKKAAAAAPNRRSRRRSSTTTTNTTTNTTTSTASKRKNSAAASSLSEQFSHIDSRVRNGDASESVEVSRSDVSVTSRRASAARVRGKRSRRASASIDASVVIETMVAKQILERAQRALKDIKDPLSAGMLAHLNTLPVPASPTVMVPDKPNFRFSSPLNPCQRKSYKNENRYLHPSPIFVEFMGDIKSLVGGCMCVRLTREDGELMSQTSQDSLIGEKLQTIEGIATAFQLKMQTTSDGNRFRLTVDVVYDMRDIGRLRECLVSSPFRVDSNRAKMPSRLLQAAQQAGDDSELAQLRRQVATLASDKRRLEEIIGALRADVERLKAKNNNA